MLKPEEIKTFIERDEGSDKKKAARVGMNYYEAKHDIMGYRVFFVNADGKLQEDKTKSNIKICHPFFTENVDQVVQYLLSGKDGFVKSDDPDLQAELDAYFNENEDFLAELYDVLTGCVAKGFENMYAYKNEDGKTAFQCADSLGVVEVKEKHTDDGCKYVIYWYTEQDKDNKKVRRIQVWDDKETHFFCQLEGGNIEKDTSEKDNPRPHALFEKDGQTYFEGYGFIPFFRIDNNRKQTSGLVPIKGLIDDYDLHACALSNNLQDTAEALYVVKNFQGDNLDELMWNIKAKKHVGVDEDGGVEIKTIDIPYQARQAKLDLDEKNIYRFGFALNTSGLKDTNATTNLAIKTAYSLLDLKANKLVIRLKQFMRKLLKVVLAEINDLNGTDYRQKDVYFDFTFEVPVNEQENAQVELTEAQRRQTEIGTLLNLAAYLDNETLMKSVCDQLDIDYNEVKDRLPSPDEDPYAVQTPVTGVDGGGAVE